MRKTRSWMRRRDIFRLGAAFALAATPVLAQQNPTVIIVSRERLLREVRASRVLAETERRFAATLQAKIDLAKEAFTAEETEIAELRGTLTSDEFSTRIADFDRRMRSWRRRAQERANDIQRGFQESRAAIVTAMPRILNQLREETGVEVIVNAEQVLSADLALDYTDRAIELFDRSGPAPVIPEIDLELPLILPEGDTPDPAQPAEQ